ncbi:MAG: GNAT family N-acetyltransferase [Firmicutes bacterium]|nr:GNAT family N-acetyltransferase [Bacillota bacterium]
MGNGDKIFTDRLKITTIIQHDEFFKSNIFSRTQKCEIGSIGASNMPDGTCNVFYDILPKHRGNGYAPEALLTLTQELVSQNKLPSLSILSNNPSSKRVAEKSGYILVGKMEDFRFGPKGIATDITTRELVMEKHDDK